MKLMLSSDVLCGVPRPLDARENFGSRLAVVCSPCRLADGEVTAEMGLVSEGVTTMLVS